MGQREELGQAVACARIPRDFPVESRPPLLDVTPSPLLKTDMS